MGDLIETPTVEAYAVMQQHERDAVARNLAHNAEVLAAEAAHLQKRQRAMASTRERDIARARAQARLDARAEVEAIYQNEYTAERILAFETHPRTPAAHGDIKACAAESHQWDIDNPRKLRKRASA